MSQTQGQIIDTLQNRILNSGIFISQKDIDYDGQKVVVYAVMPKSLASHADDVMAQILADDYDDVDDSEEEMKGDEVEERQDASHDVKKENPPVKKSAPKKAAPKKTATKKAKK